MTVQLFDRIFSRAEAKFSVSGSDDEFLNASDLFARVAAIAGILRKAGCKRVALYADNGIDWIVSDLACQVAGLRSVPLPLFFSDEQLRFAVRESGVDTLLTDRAHRLLPILGQAGRAAELAVGGRMRLIAIDAHSPAEVPRTTSKVTFTSGTTGRPKGVCLSVAQQLIVAESLVKAVAIEKPKHLCLLPLSTLLENVAGVYAPLLAGGQVIAPSLEKLGFAGSSGLSIGRLLESITYYQPDSMILVPEILRALTFAAANGWSPPASLRFVAVGGGKTAASVLRTARNVGLPVHEGYGLSECASVVSLNCSNGNLVGSVGRPLDHVDIRIEEGEIVVSGSSFLGYVGQPDSWHQECVHTGDLGHIDADGHLHIDGRKKNLLISSFGRNISPEWVESELLSGGLLQHAVVFGDAKAYCVALVAPQVASTTDVQIESWINEVNSSLPDYARIVLWQRLAEPLSCINGLATENGRPRRSLIAERYSQTLASMFDQSREVLAV